MAVHSRNPFVHGVADPAGLDEIRAWRRRLAAEQYALTELLPLDDVPGWHTGRERPEFCHTSGGFFSVVGRSVTTADGRTSWTQPMVDQPEIGLLGIAVTPTERGYAALIQAKAEPGNINGIQLSPTVQATRSNQLQVHGGRAVPYLDLFATESDAVLVDSRQSEHGAVFWRKRNRIMVVEVPPIDPQPGFRWIDLVDVLALLHDADLVHADTRAVLACLPWSTSVGARDESLRATIVHSLARGCSVDQLQQVTKWLSARRTHTSLATRPLALTDLDGWHRTDTALCRLDGHGFEVVAVRVEASGREVDRWCQPMIRQLSTGLIGLLLTRREHSVELLLQARPEPGLVDGVELGPSVQIAGGDRPISAVEQDVHGHLTRPDAVIVFDSVLSDEGGRFLWGRHRHLVVETEPFDAPPGYRWCSPGELAGLLLHSHQVNMQARSALVCLLATIGDDER